MTQHALVYQHAKRPEWGYCAVTEVHDDRTTFKFDNGLSRTIRNDHIQMMQLVELEEPEATEVRKRIAKHAAARSVKAEGKSKPKKAAAKKAPPREAAPVDSEESA